MDKIAIFDSGLGGITVLHEAMRRMPNEHFIYFADTKHVPYGSKTRQEVKECILESVHDLAEEEPIKALVVACNTATSVGIQELRKQYHFPVIGMEPAVKPAVAITRPIGKRVLVLATELTLRESKYKDLVERVDDYGIVDSLSMPGLVTLCEALQFDDPSVDDYLRQQFEGLLLDEYGTVVLGCTHFPYFKRQLAKWFAADIRMIDGTMGTVKRLLEIAPANVQGPADSEPKVDFRCSGVDKLYVHKMKQALELIADGGSNEIYESK
jgi:glutamate racemase